jgi:hypothetical protein
MRISVLVPAMVLAVPLAAGAAAPDNPPCVRASHNTAYNARPIGPHDIYLANSVGPRNAVRAQTTCIHIRPGAIVAVQSQFACVSKGDPVAVNNIGLPGERCRIVSLSPFVPGSEAKSYK